MDHRMGLPPGKASADPRTIDDRRNAFLATLAHELRNHLAPARDAVELMRVTPNDSGTVERARETISRQLNHMTRLVEDILDVARIAENKLRLELERVTLLNCIDLALEISGPLLLSRQHVVELSCPSVPIVLVADRVRLAQALSNILTNAAKYSERGQPISVHATREGNAAVVTIRDRGVGIPPEQLCAIFDLFVQSEHSTAHAHGGLGVGLAVVKQIIELHGGTVQASSEGPGSGSTFVVTIPVQPPMSELLEQPGPHDADGGAAGGHLQ